MFCARSDGQKSRLKFSGGLGRPDPSGRRHHPDSLRRLHMRQNLASGHFVCSCLALLLDLVMERARLEAGGSKLKRLEAYIGQGR